LNLAAGTPLGRYVIVAPIGAGGMGEVYRARDQELEREVAIKVLPPEFADDPGRLRRFTQEAQSAGGLNHPNVLIVHDIGSHEGAPYLVSELLDGETLKERLDSGRLPPRKACEYAAQAARGLAAAHASGVVHRDLKPDNLFITRDDRVKILDFGLAKLLEEPAVGGESQTLAIGMGEGTEPGVILGTVGYMAPEQVRGEQPDHRADIFALGTVLHEMLTGERAFQGDAPVSVLNAILVEDPPEASAVAPGVTKAHDEVVRHCLEKSPDHRFQSAQDLAFQLELLSGTASTSQLSGDAIQGPDVARRTGARPGLVALALLAAGAIGAAVGWMAHPESEAYQPPWLRPLTFSGSDRQVSVSPDGKTLAFISARDGVPRTWLKRLPGGDEVALTEGPDVYPTFSPDGSEILFGRDGDLYRVPILGGSARKVAEDAAVGDWTPNGDRIAFARVDADGTSLFVMDADGSNERLIHQEPLRAVVDVRWSPDGTRLACPFLQPGANVSDPKILIVDVESGETSTVTASLGAGQPVAVAWSGSGDVLLYTQPRGQANITGHILVRHELASDRPEILLYIDGVSWSLDVLDEGQAVVGIDSMRANLQEAPLEGGGDAPRWLTLGTSLDRQPTYSPDGRLLAFSTNRAGNLDVWVMQLESGEVRRATDHPGTDWDPSFTSDGKHLIWSSDREGHFEIWMAEPDGRNPRRISDDGFDAENGSVTPDGEWLVYNSAHPEKSGVWKRNLESGETVQLATGLTGVPEISPDGRHVLVVRGPRVGRGSVEVVRVADGVTEAFRIECTMDAGTAGSVLVGRSRWLPDGSGIAFLCEDESGRPGIYVQDFAPDRDTLSSRRFLAGIYEDRIAESFGFSPDGKRIVVSLLELRQSVVLADQLPNVSRPRPLR
jgi:serine/threonine protein kinase